MALFVAIDLDENTRDLVRHAMDDLAPRFPDARFERPEKLHVTVAYLGKIASEAYDEHARALERAARRTPLTRSGRTPAGRPDIVRGSRATAFRG